MDVASLYRHFSVGTSEHYFDDARPCVSRYYPTVAIERHRALIDDVLKRQGLPLRQGIFGLLEHAALVLPRQATQMAHRASQEGYPEDDAEIWEQFKFEIAFPTLNAVEQLDALLRARYGDRLSINLIRLLKPLDEQVFNERLSAAITTSDVEAQSTVLLFAPFLRHPLSASTSCFLPRLLQSESTLVRAFTYRMIARSGDPAALSQAVNIVPTVPHDHSAGKVEAWFLSELLIEAAVQGVTPWEDVLALSNFQHLGHLAHRLGGHAARHIAKLVDALLKRAVQLPRLPDETSNLEIEITQEPFGHPQFQSFSLDEEDVAPADFEAAWNRAIEAEEGFKERQRNLRLAFDALLTSLQDFGAETLLEQFGMDDFEAICVANPSLADQWCELLLLQRNHLHLRALRNIALLLARSIAPTNAPKAVELFDKFDPVRPLVRVVFGHVKLELAPMTIWSAADVPELEKLRFHRLDCAANNDDLACEVWAAMWNMKTEQLSRYIESRSRSKLPVAQARANMVAGLREPNRASDNILERYAAVPGFLGETNRLAHELYTRHSWAQYWLQKMASAPSAEDFWPAAVLFLVIADGRFDALPKLNETGTPVFRLYWPSVERHLEKRFEKLRKKWRAGLLADKAPWEGFLNVLGYSFVPPSAIADGTDDGANNMIGDHANVRN
jgi:hypothetical protein